MLRELTPEERGLFVAHLPICHAEIRRRRGLTLRLGEAEALAIAEDALWEATQAVRPGYPLAPFAKTVIHRRLLDAYLRQGRRDERLAVQALDALDALPVEVHVHASASTYQNLEDRLEMLVFAAALAHWLTPDQEAPPLPPRLAKALASLGEEDRLILRARMDDVAWLDIKKKTGIPERTAQRRFAKVLQRLQRTWEASRR